MYIKNPTPLQVPSSDSAFTVNGRKYSALPPVNEPGSMIDIDDVDGEELLKIYEFLQVIDEKGNVIRTGSEKPWLTTQDPREDSENKVYRNGDGTITVNGVKYTPEVSTVDVKDIQKAVQKDKEVPNENVEVGEEVVNADTKEGEDLLQGSDNPAPEDPKKKAQD